MTTVVLSPSEPIENAPIQLNLHVVTTLQVGTDKVEHLTNEFVSQFPFLLTAKKPELTIYQEQVIWRVPLTIALLEQDDVVQVGELEIDAYTGHILNGAVEHSRIVHVVSILSKSKLDVDNKHEKVTKSTTYPFPQPAFHYLAEIAEDLDIDDLAENHDHYLYGVEKQ